jgi:hypothetical protein
LIIIFLFGYQIVVSFSFCFRHVTKNGSPWFTYFGSVSYCT